MIEHILYQYKIDDIVLHFDNNENLVATDDEYVWFGEEFYKFLFDELFNYNEDGTVNLIDNRDLARLKEYRKKYNNQSENITRFLDNIIEKVHIEKVKYNFDTNNNLQSIEYADGEKVDITKFYNLLLTESYNELNENEINRLKEELKNSENFDTNNNFKQSEKENSAIKVKNKLSQMTLFAPREKELAARLVDIFNSLDTKYKGTFYVEDISLEVQNVKIIMIKKPL